ncbi:MAG: hypothetical protein JF628_12155 [Sphingomonas sp.]|nr:hypothetical protein [Sphingomonas sp.]
MVVLPPAPFMPFVQRMARTAVPAVETRASFGEWLLKQAKPGALGDLAKAARLDRQFPKRGSADDARVHFSAVGADGDAFAALEDAEREYDRQMR